MRRWIRVTAAGLIAATVGGCSGAASVAPAGKVESTQGMKPETLPSPPGAGKLPPPKS
jgi:hypothetical protein